MNAKLQATACEVLLEEVRRTCADSRACQVAQYLLSETQSRLLRDEEPPEFQPISIHVGLMNNHDITPAQAGEWVRRARVHQWWSERASSFDQELERRGIDTRVHLTTVVGGGAGVTTKYRLNFSNATVGNVRDKVEDIRAEACLVSACASPAADAGTSSAGSPEVVHISGNIDETRSVPTLIAEYTREPVRPSWPFRWILGRGEIESATWRGGILLFVVVSMALTWLLPIFWIVGILIKPSTIGHGSLIGVLILIAAWTAIWWPAIWPWLRVARDRVTIAPITYLAMREPVGQIEFVRDRHSRWMRGVLRLARYSAVCPKCSGKIDLTSGRRDFPGRVVGRCADSPMEHVYAFDPVSRTGSPLR